MDINNKFCIIVSSGNLLGSQSDFVITGFKSEDEALKYCKKKEEIIEEKEKVYNRTYPHHEIERDFNLLKYEIVIMFDNKDIDLEFDNK